MWVLGIEPRSFGRVASAFSCQPISPSPPHYILKSLKRFIIVSSGPCSQYVLYTIYCINNYRDQLVCLNTEVGFQGQRLYVLCTTICMLSYS